MLCVFFILWQSISVCMSNLINRKGKENGILRKHAKICTTGHFDYMAAALFRDVPLYLIITHCLRNELQHLPDGPSP